MRAEYPAHAACLPIGLPTIVLLNIFSGHPHATGVGAGVDWVFDAESRRDAYVSHPLPRIRVHRHSYHACSPRTRAMPAFYSYRAILSKE